MTYGVIWRKRDGPRGRGKLELLPESVLLDGVAGGRRTKIEISYSDVTEVRVGRTADERIDGLQAVRVESRDGSVLSIAAIAQPGSASEIAYRLEAAKTERFLVVVPIRSGARKTVENLLAARPFDLDALDVVRLDVYVTAAEAIFAFESHGRSVDHIAAELAVVRTVAGWGGSVVGRARTGLAVWSRRKPGSADHALLPPGLR